jgi:serine/threonine-protein kinase
MIVAGAYATPAEAARFRAEAEAVARLQHPNIVQVFRLDEHDGLPCLIMEYVPGGTLSQGLDGTPLPPRRAAETAEILARAMYYAHGQGVVHRDLKPGNVLLAADGTPKIADFGLAKLLEGARATITRTGEILGTPSYMAPEQAGGPARVGPAADVYALGAMLYEMLTGRPPFRAETPEETLRQVVAEGPVPPSRLQPRLPRDLETICLKCLEKEPAKRYDSAEALADDLRRYLDSRPIRARRVGPVGRLARWAGRRPAVAALTAAVVLLAAAGVVGLVLSARNERRLRLQAEEKRVEAEESLAQARQVVDEMYTKVAAELEGRPGMDAYQRTLLEKALRFYERFALPKSGDPAVRLEAGRAGVRAGEILVKLGQTGSAEAAYGRALRLLEAVAAADPADAESRRSLAAGHYRLARLYRELGKKAVAEVSMRRAAELFGSLAAVDGSLAVVDPAAPVPRRGLADALIGLGIIEQDLGRPADAEDSYRKGIALFEGLVHDHPGVADYRGDLAAAWNNLADLQRKLGRPAEAMTSWERALAAFRVLARDHPDANRYREALARATHNLATVQAEVGRHAEALVSYRRAAELREALVRDHPDRPLHRYGLAGTYSNLGNLLRNAGQPSEARHAYEQAIAMKERLVRDHPDVAEYRNSLAISLAALGFLLAQIGRESDALPAIRRAAALQEGLVRDYPDVVEYRGPLATSLAAIGSFQRQAGQAEEALRSLRRALELWEPLRLVQPGDFYNIACAHALCMALIGGGRAALSPEERADRESHGERAMAALRRAVAAGAAAPAWLAQDHDLDPLRSREDFRALLRDLVFPADPFARPRSAP